MYPDKVEAQIKLNKIKSVLDHHTLKPRMEQATYTFWPQLGVQDEHSYFCIRFTFQTANL